MLYQLSYAHRRVREQFTPCLEGRKSGVELTPIFRASAEAAEETKETEEAKETRTFDFQETTVGHRYV